MIRRLLMVAQGGGSFVGPVEEDITVANLMSSWWSHPKAIEMGGRLYFSSVRDTGANFVFSVSLTDHNDLDSFTLMVNEPDDHNAAALLVPDDKPPMVAYARHNQDSLLRFRKGSTIGDITSLGSQTTVNIGGDTTYAQLWRRPGTDEVHAFTREATRYWRNTYTTNYGTSWSSPRRVFDFGSGQYAYINTVPIAADPDRLRVALVGHPTNGSLHDIWYAEIDMDSGDVTNQAGAVLGNMKSGTGLPVNVTASCDKIVDTDTAGGHNCRLFEVGDGPDPEVCYGDWTNDTNMIYYRTVYSGSVWTPTSVVAAGDSFGYISNIHYNGGIMFPRNTPGDVVYLSRESSGTWSIEKWEFSGSWSMTDTIVSGVIKHVRPQPVDGADEGGVLVYHDVTSYPRTATASLDWAADFVGPP